MLSDASQLTTNVIMVVALAAGVSGCFHSSNTSLTPAIAVFAAVAQCNFGYIFFISSAYF
jgi:hypothetical protein